MSSPSGDAAAARELLRLDLKRELYLYLFSQLDRAIYELYTLCEFDSDADNCAAAAQALEVAHDDFSALQERIAVLLSAKPSAAAAAVTPSSTVAPLPSPLKSGAAANKAFFAGKSTADGGVAAASPRRPGNLRVLGSPRRGDATASSAGDAASSSPSASSGSGGAPSSSAAISRGGIAWEVRTRSHYCTTHKGAANAMISAMLERMRQNSATGDAVSAGAPRAGGNTVDTDGGASADAAGDAASATSVADATPERPSSPARVSKTTVTAADAADGFAPPPPVTRTSSAHKQQRGTAAAAAATAPTLTAPAAEGNTTRGTHGLPAAAAGTPSKAGGSGAAAAPAEDAPAHPVLRLAAHLANVGSWGDWMMDAELAATVLDTGVAATAAVPKKLPARAPAASTPTGLRVQRYAGDAAAPATTAAIGKPSGVPAAPSGKAWTTSRRPLGALASSSAGTTAPPAVAPRAKLDAGVTATPVAATTAAGGATAPVPSERPMRSPVRRHSVGATPTRVSKLHAPVSPTASTAVAAPSTTSTAASSSAGSRPPLPTAIPVPAAAPHSRARPRSYTEHATASATGALAPTTGATLIRPDDAAAAAIAAAVGATTALQRSLSAGNATDGGIAAPASSAGGNPWQRGRDQLLHALGVKQPLPGSGVGTRTGGAPRSRAASMLSTGSSGSVPLSGAPASALALTADEITRRMLAEAAGPSGIPRLPSSASSDGGRSGSSAVGRPPTALFSARSGGKTGKPELPSGRSSRRSSRTASSAGSYHQLHNLHMQMQLAAAAAARASIAALTSAGDTAAPASKRTGAAAAPGGAAAPSSVPVRLARASPPAAAAAAGAASAAAHDAADDGDGPWQLVKAGGITGAGGAVARSGTGHRAGAPARLSVPTAAAIASSASAGDGATSPGPRSLHEKLSSPQRVRDASASTKRGEERRAAAAANRTRLEEERKRRAAEQNSRVAGVRGQQAAKAAAVAMSLQERLEAAEARHRSTLEARAARAGVESAKVQEVDYINTVTAELARAERQEDISRRQLEACARKTGHIAAIVARSGEHAHKVVESAAARRAREDAEAAERKAAIDRRLAEGEARRAAHLRGVVEAAVKVASPTKGARTPTAAAASSASTPKPSPADSTVGAPAASGSTASDAISAAADGATVPTLARTVAGSSLMAARSARLSAPSATAAGSPAPFRPSPLGPGAAAGVLPAVTSATTAAGVAGAAATTSSASPVSPGFVSSAVATSSGAQSSPAASLAAGGAADDDKSPAFVVRPAVATSPAGAAAAPAAAETDAAHAHSTSSAVQSSDDRVASCIIVAPATVPATAAGASCGISASDARPLNPAHRRTKSSIATSSSARGKVRGAALAAGRPGVAAEAAVSAISAEGTASAVAADTIVPPTTPLRRAGATVDSKPSASAAPVSRPTAKAAKPKPARRIRGPVLAAAAQLASIAADASSGATSDARSARTPLVAAASAAFPTLLAPSATSPVAMLARALLGVVRVAASAAAATSGAAAGAVNADAGAATHSSAWPPLHPSQIAATDAAQAVQVLVGLLGHRSMTAASADSPLGSKRAARGRAAGVVGASVPAAAVPTFRTGPASDVIDIVLTTAVAINAGEPPVADHLQVSSKPQSADHKVDTAAGISHAAASAGSASASSSRSAVGLTSVLAGGGSSGAAALEESASSVTAPPAASASAAAGVATLASAPPAAVAATASVTGGLTATLDDVLSAPPSAWSAFLGTGAMPFAAALQAAPAAIVQLASCALAQFVSVELADAKPAVVAAALRSVLVLFTCRPDVRTDVLATGFTTHLVDVCQWSLRSAAAAASSASTDSSAADASAALHDSLAADACGLLWLTAQQSADLTAQQAVGPASGPAAATLAVLDATATYAVNGGFVSSVAAFITAVRAGDAAWQQRACPALLLAMSVVTAWLQRSARAVDPECRKPLYTTMKEWALRMPAPAAAGSTDGDGSAVSSGGAARLAPYASALLAALSEASFFDLTSLFLCVLHNDTVTPGAARAGDVPAGKARSRTREDGPPAPPSPARARGGAGTDMVAASSTGASKPAKPLQARTLLLLCAQMQALQAFARADLWLLQRSFTESAVMLELHHAIPRVLDMLCGPAESAHSDRFSALLIDALGAGCLHLLGALALNNAEQRHSLHWGTAPTTLQRLCNLPFRFFSHDRYRRQLLPTLIVAVHNSALNIRVIHTDVSAKLLLDFIADEAVSEAPAEAATMSCAERLETLSSRVPPDVVAEVAAQLVADA